MKTAMYKQTIDRKTQLVLASKKDIKLADHALINKYGNEFLYTADEGNLAGKAFMLNTEKFNWLLAKDDQGNTCLIPRKKAA